MHIPFRLKAAMIAALLAGTLVVWFVASFVVGLLSPAIAGMAGWALLGGIAGYILRCYHEVRAEESAVGRAVVREHDPNTARELRASVPVKLPPPALPRRIT